MLGVLNSLDIEDTYRKKVGRPQKMSDLEVVALSLTAEYMSIDSENSLFEKIDDSVVESLLE